MLPGVAASSMMAARSRGKKRMDGRHSHVEADPPERAPTLALAGYVVLALCGLLWCLNAQAQTATYSHGNSATASGAGTGGTPSLSFNVQAGQNRVVFLNAVFEREHCSNTLDWGDENDCNRQVNWASPSMVSSSGAAAQITFNISGPGGSLSLRNPLGTSEGDLYFAYIHRSSGNAPATVPLAVFSHEIYAVALYESQLRSLLGGAASGTVTISLPASGLNAPRRTGDEALLSALQFNHVHQRMDGNGANGVVRSAYAIFNCGASGSLYFGGQAVQNWVCPSGGGLLPYDAGQAPGTGDGVLQFGLNGYSRSGGPHGFQTASGLTEVHSPAVINTNAGTWLGGTEADGFSTTYQWANSGLSTAGAPALTARAPSGTTGGLRTTYTVRRPRVDLSITKADGITTMLSGASTTYTVVVTNRASSATMAYADGAVVRDPVATGLTKTAVSCTAAGGAVCPTGLTVAALESGVTIATFPPGGTLTFSVTATANAGTTGSVTNTATVAPPTGYTDENSTDNTASDTNTLLIPLTLSKAWANATVNDRVTLSLTGSPAPSDGAALVAVANTANETDTSTTPYGVVAGRTYTITEAFNVGTAAGYIKTLACTGNTGTNAALTYTANALSGTIRVGSTATAITCTFGNARLPQLTLRKTVTNDNGGTQLATAWTLSATGPTSISGAMGASAVTNATVNPGTYTLSESATPTGYTAGTYSCVTNGGAAVVSNSIVLAAGDVATCTINNDDRPATLTLRKTVTNDNGGTQPATAWTLSAAGPTSISGATGTPAVTSATVNPGTYTLSESTTPGGYTASGYSCVKNGGAAVSSNSITLVAGDAATCTINNNDRPATLTLIKTVTNDNGGTQLPTAWTLSAAGPTAISGTTGTPAVTSATVNPGTYALSESTTPGGYTASSYSCVKNGGAAVSGNSITLAAGDAATCTINNNDRPATLTLIKTVTNDNGGTQLPTAWTLSATGPTSISGTTGTPAVTNATVNPGTYTLSESATPTGYTASTYSCVRNGGAAMVSNSITLAAGDTATCTINNNDVNQTDVSITKAASADTAVRGDEVTFTLLVRNLGIAAAHGTVVRDPSVAGLDCTAADLSAPTCSATGGATCPTPLTATGLQSGVAVPALPNGGAVTIGLTCRVTASGLP
ncbi:hypothetical protein [Pseudoxanthomonas japonensis]|uniref:hypothetical protein n=1 Tax=Pseudoxanthomonas japonensis TaxID=69284 RepID=UPI00374A66CF